MTLVRPAEAAEAPVRIRPRRAPAGIVVAAVLVALFAAIPLLFVVGYAVDLGWTQTRDLVFRARVGELLWNTLRLTFGAMALSAVIGVGAAWLVERSAVPGRRLWTPLLVAPLAVPAFVNSYAWTSISRSLDGYWGALLVVTLSYFPLVFLPVTAALRGLDPALEETARSLGFGAWATFRRVVLPQLRLAVYGGTLLVGVHMLAEFGALQLLRFPTFTTAIYDQFRSSFNGPAANVLASVLAICCLVFLLAEIGLRGGARYSRLGSGAARPATRHPLGPWTWPAAGLLAGLTTLALLVPIGQLVRWLVVGRSTALPWPELTAAAATSVGLGALAAGTALVLALALGWLSERHGSRLGAVLERTTYFGSAMPGIVTALALITVSIRLVPGLYQTVPLLVAAYAILCLPRAVINVRSALSQARPLYDDVARSLGAGALARLRRVSLPLMASGLGAGAALVFIAAATELTATLLLAPTGTQTLATEFWAQSSDLQYGAAAPYAALMVLISAPATYLLTRQARRSVLW